MSQCKFSVNTESPSVSIRGRFDAQLYWIKPEEGVFVKNSEGSLVCTLFDSISFSHLVRDGGKHPLTREPITSSMIVSQEQCIYDQTKGNFVIK
ncbi:T3SS effector NleG family protein [Escherichia coli]|uniref:T3SS effector NleG family protein n=1 Tax=Escherichia coli TaxID=562 RepID=UPI001FCB0E03|nr:T3SS effector NleG family protein [Escherichia coli]